MDQRVWPPVSTCLVISLLCGHSHSRNPAVTGPPYSLFKDFSKEEKLPDFNTPNWKDEWKSLQKVSCGERMTLPFTKANVLKVPLEHMCLTSKLQFLSQHLHFRPPGLPLITPLGLTATPDPSSLLCVWPWASCAEQLGLSQFQRKSSSSKR